MRKLISLFKSLPPEMRMLIALAGFGTPAAMIYGLKQFLFPNVPYRILILCIGGVVALIAGGSYLISKGFKRGGRRRTRRMESALTDEGERGPVSMDVRAAIKSNNDKFLSAIRDMRKNLGINVYDLPWYIVIGDSGCGKTKLVNEGGLTFSTGKPEGYQLGTLNYNWWFTEDAIFIDMAGRLCNPQDDADRKEWMAFLDTVGKGRKGYPINGALVCVSAEHLLADPPEKHEADANTALERLRDLQSRLGVTFATYLIVTKCDKIPGFMQFFDRAERDITVKNQIFGWSKPGEFNELRDPEEFVHDFNSVYGRLNDLRLRRLNDDADEIDLGLAYAFPEEFRELRDPLSSYVRTLFPMIKNPRAIKNLIFRGVYFTSATQEGELILRHLTERLGPDAADQFPRLDLYPNKRPHFIKDLLFRKVFPEHGLVFRNEQQAVRNKHYNRLLKIGGSALFVALATLLAVSVWRFNKVIGTPRNDAWAAKEAVPITAKSPDESLKMTSDLARDTVHLKQHRFWASMLSWGVGTDRPIEDLGTIRTGYFEKFLLRPALARVTEVLRTKELGSPSGPEADTSAADAYMRALEEYARWLGCAEPASGGSADCVDYESFEKLWAIVPKEQSGLGEKEETFLAEAKTHFEDISGLRDGRNPARLLGAPEERLATLGAALGRVSKYLEGYARLDSGHPNEVIREWMRILEGCTQVEVGYAGMVGTELERLAGMAELKNTVDAFLQSHERFDRAWKGFAWKLPAPPGKLLQIPPLVKTIEEVRMRHWIDYQERLKKAYLLGGTAGNSEVEKAINGLSRGDTRFDLEGLDAILWKALRGHKLTQQTYSPEWFDSKRLGSAVKEVPAVYDHIILLDAGDGESKGDSLVPTEHARTVKSVIDPMAVNLGQLLPKLAGSGEESTATEWVSQLKDLRRPRQEDAAKDVSLANVDPRWNPNELDQLRASYLTVIARVRLTAMLNDMRTRLGRSGDWGIANTFPPEEQLAATWSYFDIPIPQDQPSEPAVAEPEPSPPAEEPMPTADEEEEEDWSLRRRPSRTAATAPPVAEEVVPAPPPPDARKRIPARCTRSFFFNRMEECGHLLHLLGRLDPASYFPDPAQSESLHGQCRRLLAEAGSRYASAYMAEWAQAYRASSLAEPARLQSARDWSGLAELLEKGTAGAKPGRSGVADELSAALSEVLEKVAFWDWIRDEGATGWGPAGSPDNPIWAQIQGWVNEAKGRTWGSAGQFVLDCPRAYVASDTRNPPWTAIAHDVTGRWQELAGAVVASGALPREFSADRRGGGVVAIPWGKVGEARARYGLQSEKLSGQLAAVETRAQELLSCELTNIYAGIQRRHLSGNSAAGWPYLGGLQTVDLAAFGAFLKEVEAARAALAPLEDDLALASAELEARRRFYTGCRSWQEFISQTSATQGLDLSVRFVDPVENAAACKTRIDDTAQHYYGSVKLDLGAGQEIVIPTTRAAPGGGVSQRWTIGGGNVQIRISWINAIPLQNAPGKCPDVTQELGPSSALSLCAYLRQGTGGGARWVTCHGFNLIEELKKLKKDDLLPAVNPAKPMIGVGLEFTLGRPIPDAIPTLQECRSVASR